MSSNRNPPVGGGGVDDPDWIDRILDRAAEQAAQETSETAVAAPPRVPAVDSTMPLPIVPIEAAVATAPADGLLEVRWVDSLEVSPASTPIATPKAGLRPQDVGHSAWADELRSVGDEDPHGWEKLSWQDLEQRGPQRSDPLQGKPSTFSRILREWGPVLIAAVTIAMVTRFFLVGAYHIPSLSMAPTLEKGDRVIVNKLSYRFGEVERGQVVVFSKPPNQPAGANDLIKRVIGLPGETVQLSAGNVFIDGLLVNEPYLAQPESTRSRSLIPGCAQAQPSTDTCTVPEGYLFMMGDNRSGSQDSRVFGPVAIDSVVGRAFVRLWPLNEVNWL